MANKTKADSHNKTAEATRVPGPLQRRVGRRTTPETGDKQNPSKAPAEKPGTTMRRKNKNDENNPARDGGR